MCLYVLCNMDEFSELVEVQSNRFTLVILLYVMATVLWLLMFLFNHLELSSSINYIDHITCNKMSENFTLYPNDALLSLDKGTRLIMRYDRKWVLQSNINGSFWKTIWETNSSSDTITSNRPSFVIHNDRTISVYIPTNCTKLCKEWKSNTYKNCCATYHLFVHNNGYAYLLNDSYHFAGFTTNNSIIPTSDPTLYPASLLIDPDYSYV